MSVLSAVTEIAKSVAIWLNPERKEKLILRGAIESAEQLLLILRREGKYKDLPVQKLFDLERHYQKRFDSWKDGRT